MKLKLDENLGRRTVKLFGRAGHDVATVASEEFFSVADEDLIGISRREGRCLVTLNLDFSNLAALQARNTRGSRYCECLANPATAI